LEDSFRELLGRLQRGDDDAAAAVFNRFAHRLIALARTRLDGLIRNKVDPADILQSVFRSFFLHHAEEAFDLGGWESLWGLLTTLTVRKCGRKQRFFRQERRDVRREVGLGVAERQLDPQPSAEQALILAETIEQVLARHDERDRQIIVLALQGHDTVAISEQAGCTQRTVQRVLERLRSRLRRLSQEEDAD
jgi:RNA polymerase sigma-70 factor (ECF subfamily)